MIRIFKAWPQAVLWTTDKDAVATRTAKAAGNLPAAFLFEVSVAEAGLKRVTKMSILILRFTLFIEKEKRP